MYDVLSHCSKHPTLLNIIPYSGAQTIANTYRNCILVATLFTCSDVLSSVRFISTECWHARPCAAGRNNINKKLAGRWFDGEACNAQKYVNTTF